MGSLRRLYLYVVSAISLLAVAAGVVSLLETVLRQIEDALGGSVMMSGGTGREQLSLSIALIGVGGPIWLLHWWLARRGMRSEGPQGSEDRASAIRSGYLAIVATAALATGMLGLVAAASTVVGEMLGFGDDFATWSQPLAAALVAWPIWAVTTRSRAAEIRTTPMTGAAAWLTRLYRYGALYASLLVILVASAALIATLLSAMVARPEFGLDDDWWRRAAIGQACAVLVGLAAWLLHWRDASATIRDAAAIGEDDRRTRLRAAYFGGALVTATTWSAIVVAGSLADLLRRIVGLTAGDAMALMEQVVGPLLAVIPAMAAGWWHARFVAREARGLGPGSAASWGRNVRLLVSLVGLALLSAGSIQLLATALARLASTTEPSMTGDRGATMDVPWYLAQLVVGAVLWLPAWSGILAARARDVAAERAAASTRAHLFLVVGVALVAAVPTAVLTLYRLLDTLLGGGTTRPFLAELSFPLSVLLGAVVIGGYHLQLLLGDLRATPAVSQAAPLAAEAVPGQVGGAGEAVVAGWARPRVVVEVSLPASADADHWIETLREGLPLGATLEVRRPA